MFKRERCGECAHAQLPLSQRDLLLDVTILVETIEPQLVCDQNNTPVGDNDTCQFRPSRFVPTNAGNFGS